MKQFLAELGYTSCWAFGVPKQRLMDNFEGYYRVGLFWFVAGVASCAMLLGICIYLLIYKLRKVEKE